ncbi:leucine-rich repeat domain-containing protein [Cohnella soli]|uniref:Leucine-rich repeat domain-containing protein n=1 Tax=Cohnella soli TaxID=425005 RepID=A0ABW0HZT3_9BACL
MKENNVYYVDQTINNYYGAAPARTPSQPRANFKRLFVVSFILILAFVGYLFWNNRSFREIGETPLPIRTVPESEALLFFLKDIFNKGEAMPTEEELASIRYLSARHKDDQWSFDYSLEDPFTNEKAEISNYVVMDKILNTQKIEQKDFEAFSGLTVLNLMGEYEISQGQKISFRHLQGLQSYSGGFNESFRLIAQYFSDNSKITELTTQIRSNEELALLLQFPNLHSLKITYINESVTDFHLLGQLPIKSLSLSLVKDLKWVSSLTGLESLTLENSDATDFSAMYALSQLKELKLSLVRNLKTIDFIQNMPNLQSLDLDSIDLTNVERLRNKSSLTKLRLSSLYKIESVEVLNSLPSLTELTVTGYSGAVSSISAPNLRKAELEGSFIPKLEAPALKSLTVYIGGSGNELNGAQLVKFPQLEELSAMESGEFVELPALNRLPKLQTLNLNETAFYGETSALFSLKQVKTINCKECRFQFNSQNPFANDTLEHLTLNHSSFRIGNGDWLHEIDKVMPYFAALTTLRSFTLQDDSLQSLQFMRNWRHIELLHLENNAISDVEPLAKLERLQKLYLLGNQVQNQSVLDKRVLIY